LRVGSLVILESTSPVGTTEKMAGWLQKARPDLTFPQTHGEASDIRIAHCPERVLPGKVMQELITNDRIIGGMTPLCSREAEALYRIFVKGDCLLTDTRTAEMAKLTENSFRDVNIAFANELSMICDTQGINVWELIQLANRHPRVNILQPGPGVGGHCIAVDPWFIVNSAPDQAHLIRTAREVNDAKPNWVIEKTQTAVGQFLADNPEKRISDVTLACYGLAFKPDIDDLRTSPALDIAIQLGEMAFKSVLAIEPNIAALPKAAAALTLASFEDASSADVHVLLVDHAPFKAAAKPSGYVVDSRGIWP
ncbi:MAG: UDP-N-acetyl-D-mannosamine dehydrogenase, partial [Parasphingorhabdus sp.]|uniref:UDP-N-acetyl-D-mannosamine dehydrogenase n=1 Tax=Parasphingorhabdus sp. TaxID=2709688 RepID=UPI0030027696